MGVGGTDDSAQKLQLAENRKTLELIERQTQRASRDVSKLFGSAEQNLLAGQQGAADVMGQMAPQQISALQQGNLNAQNQLLAGLPQMQNALLGLPTDLSALQPSTVNVDTSFLQNTRLPQFQTSQQALVRTPEEEVQEQGFVAQADVSKLPTFTKRDFSLGGMKDGGLDKQIEFLAGVQSLTPEARAQLQQQGPSAVGLGGKRGTRLFNEALAGTFRPMNETQVNSLLAHKLRGF